MSFLGRHCRCMSRWKSPIRYAKRPSVVSLFLCDAVADTWHGDGDFQYLFMFSLRPHAPLFNIFFAKIFAYVKKML